MMGEHPEVLGSVSQMGVVGRCRFQGDFCHNEVGDDRKKVGQDEGLGSLALEDHSQHKGHGREVLNHLGEVDYECMDLEKHSVVPVDRDNLRKKCIYILKD